jgi:type IV pilus assembly protein PilY1
MGYMRFVSCREEDSSVNYSSGCNTLVRGFDFDYDGLWKKIKDETNANRTPLASQIKEGTKYLNDHKATDDAKACRKKFLVMVTDGWDTLACGGTYDDEYTTRSFQYKRRRATVAAIKTAIDSGYQVFVVGFGADMPLTEKNTLEWAAFKGGTNNPAVADSGNTSAITFSSDPCQEYASCSPDQADCTNAPNDPGYKNLSGYAFLASDAATLANSLKSIFRTILERAFSFTAPSVPVVRMLNDDVVYISSFTPSDMPVWFGDIKAYVLKADGTVDVDGNGYPISPKWSALDKLNLKDPTTRQIYTYLGGMVKTFTSANVSKTDLGVATDGERDALVNHIRGIDNYDVDRDTNTSEWRKNRMGDIYHSNAVIVGTPNADFEDEGFTKGTPGSFYELNKNRTKTLIVGANDGMLHIFDADKDTGGNELRAFIPPVVLPNLKGIKSDWDQFLANGTFSAANHRYFVDSTPKVADVWFYSTADDTTKEPAEWKTVLVSGLRKGGKTYFALDVTNAASSLGYLWQFPAAGDTTTLNKMGQSWSEPAIARVKIMVGGNLVERWVAFIGGGFSYDDSLGKCFFVIDIKTGAIIKEFSGLTGMTKSFAAPPKAVDLNADGYVDKVYIGDLGAQMWVFNVSSTDTASWTGYRLFCGQAWTPGKHSIYYQASVAMDLKRTPWVFFGTGDREAPRDTNIYERFFAIKDDDPASFYKEGDLLNVTSTNTFTPPTTEKGWYFTLSKGEKVLARAQAFNHLVFFTTYSPSEDPEPCTVGGTARLYIVDYLSGGGAAADVDEVSDLTGSGKSRFIVIGTGMPSDPVITVKGGVAAIIVGISSGQTHSQLAPIQSTPTGVLYWREVIN